MTVSEVDIEKPKNQPTRRFRRGCMLAVAAMSVMCYGVMWLFARYGGEWAATHADSPLPESNFIGQYDAQEGFLRYLIKVYTVPGTLEEVNTRFFPDLTIKNGRLILPDSASVDVINRFWRFTWNFTQGTDFDASDLCYSSATLYMTGEQVARSKGIPLPSNSLILETQTCFMSYGTFSM